MHPRNHLALAMTKRSLMHVTLTVAALIVATGLTLSADLFADREAPFDESWAALLADTRSTRQLSPWEEALYDPRRLMPLPTAQIDSETLWLARAIYSESKRPEEQALIAWVIRNRVETGYRGKRTFQSVVLDPWQFSAFLEDAPKRDFYASLTPEQRLKGWRTALAIAHAVRHADDDHRPFSPRTRHFYSERSLNGSRPPAWADGRIPLDVDPIVPIDDRRFRFFEDVS